MQVARSLRVVAIINQPMFTSYVFSQCSYVATYKIHGMHHPGIAMQQNYYYIVC